MNGPLRGPMKNVGMPLCGMIFIYQSLRGTCYVPRMVFCECSAQCLVNKGGTCYTETMRGIKRGRSVTETISRERVRLFWRISCISCRWHVHKAARYPGPARRYVHKHKDPFTALLFCCLLALLCAAKPVWNMVLDTEPPVLTGARDRTVEVGGTVLYRDGVSAVDEVDGPVPLQIDAGAVDLNQAGVYPVTYSAVDAAGNVAQQTVTLTVTQPVDEDAPFVELLNALTQEILAEITTGEMDQRETARAIFNYVHDNIQYTGTSDKRSWVRAAYNGFTRGIGDCFNYFACSKALLTQAGIENIDLERVGGASQHFWQLVNVGDGWYHFDACPIPSEFWLDAFLFTEQQARDFTQWTAETDGYQNYYVYDYEACPVQVEGAE